MSNRMRQRVSTFVVVTAMLALVLRSTEAGPWWWAVGAAITAWHAYETARGLRLDRRRRHRPA